MTRFLHFTFRTTIYEARNSECFAQHHKLCNVRGGLLSLKLKGLVDFVCAYSGAGLSLSKYIHVIIVQIHSNMI